MFSVCRAIAFIALLAQAVAGVAFTNANMQLYAGEPFTLTWKEAQGAVTIRLMVKKSETTLDVVDTLTTEGSGDSFTWVPPLTLDSGTYAFEISDTSGDSPNYSSPFTYNKDAVAPVTTSKESSTSSSASSSHPSITATLSGNSTETTTTTTSDTSESTETTSKSTSSKHTSSQTTSSPESTGTVPNLNGGSSAGVKLGSSIVTVIVGLVGAGLFALL